MVGLASPRQRLGMGVCVERNTNANAAADPLTLTDVGTAKEIAEGANVIITCEMVDAGLEALTQQLSDSSAGAQYSHPNLRRKRLKAGSHGGWGSTKHIMLYKLLYACRRCQLAVLLFDFGQQSVPDKLIKLNIAFAFGQVNFVDMALNIPGLYYYTRGPPDSGQREVSSFFPSMHDHGGGTFKWYGPSSRKQRMTALAKNRKPPNRTAHSLPQLVEKLATGRLRATEEDLNFIIASVVRSVNFYQDYYHKTADIISNDISSTVAGLRHHITECREAKQMIEKDMSFFLRIEVRFDGEALQTALGLNVDHQSAYTFMRYVVSMIFYYHLEIWNVQWLIPCTTDLEVLVPPSIFIGRIEATLFRLEYHYSITKSTNLAHLGLQTLLRLQRWLCIARAMLFCCSSADLAFLQATEHLEALSDQYRSLMRSEGSKKAEAKAAKARGEPTAEPTAEPTPPEEPAQAPTPRSTYELWFAVAQSFPVVTQLRISYGPPWN